MLKPIDYAGPAGRELPGEYWNARIIREHAEAAATGCHCETCTATFTRDEMVGEKHGIPGHYADRAPKGRRAMLCQGSYGLARLQIGA